MKIKDSLIKKTNQISSKDSAKGITLVALVVTIVVLLILAGITVTMLFGDNGIIKKAQDAKNATERDQETTEEGLNSLVNQMNDILGIKTPIEKTTPYVRYYADFTGDGTVDGVIYADLAVGNTGSGTWLTTNTSTYTIPTVKASELKDYYVSQTSYEGAFGTKDVISPISTTGKDRFYVMALEDLDSSYHYWYYNAYDKSTNKGKMTDYADTTSTAFEAGKKNTATMRTKYDNKDYGAPYTTGTYTDLWGMDALKTKVSEGWFVPSKDEWSAFAGELGISETSSDATYYGNFGLSDSYWSSSQVSTSFAWFALFTYGYMDGYFVYDHRGVRLSATF